MIMNSSSRIKLKFEKLKSDTLDKSQKDDMDEFVNDNCLSDKYSHLKQKDCIRFFFFSIHVT